MKKLAMCVMFFLALAPTTYAQGITGVQVKNEKIQKKGKQVNVSMLFDLSQMDVKRQRSVQLEPVIVSADGSHERALPGIVVDGKIRNRVHHRQSELQGSNGLEGSYVQLSRKNGTEQAVDYKQSVAYESWMADSRLEVRETVTGCAECGVGEGTVPVTDKFVTIFKPNFVAQWVEPEPEPVKTRAKSAEARIQFRQDKYDILPDYKGNRAELDTVRKSVSVVYDDPDVTITGISITGYASPEGSVPHNKTLSHNRAKALLSYLVQRYEVPMQNCKVDGRGEDWEGLREEVEKMTDLREKERVLAVIDECTGDRDECEKQLKAISPKAEVYDHIYEVIYPRLRRNEYRIEYNVRNFNVEEAKQIIRTNPTKLSLTEMYQVAGTYEKGSKEYSEVLAIAAATYPNQTAALNNAALASIDKGDYPAAIATLSGRAAGNAALLNTLGVAYARSEQYNRARQCFQDAKSLGSKLGAENLEQVDKYLEDL